MPFETLLEKIDYIFTNLDYVLVPPKKEESLEKNVYVFEISHFLQNEMVSFFIGLDYANSYEEALERVDKKVGEKLLKKLVDNFKKDVKVVIQYKFELNNTTREELASSVVKYAINKFIGQPPPTN